MHTKTAYMQTKTAYTLSADQMAALIVEHGVERMVAVTNDAAKMLVAAWGDDGIPAPLNWRTQGVGGAVLFVQVDKDSEGYTVITGGERILCVNASETARARYARLLADSDAPVRLLMCPASDPRAARGRD